MKRILYKRNLAAAVLCLGLTMAGTPASVLALQGSGDSSTGSNTSSGSNITRVPPHTGITPITPIRDDDSAVSTASNSGSGNLQSRVQQLLDDKRKDVTQKTTQQRQKACTTHQTTINDRFTTLGSKAQLYLDRYNGVFTKVQAYQTKKQLSVANYDTLANDVTTKQTAATNAVNTLKGLAGTKIDCTTTDPATTVADVKTAADDARTALQAYRSSLKTLIDALIAAKPAASTNTGSN